MAPPTIAGRARASDWLSALLFAALIVIAVLTFRQYGVSWDEEFHVEYGARVHRYYRTYFDQQPDKSVLGYMNTRLYGGFFDVVAFEINRVLPFGEYENRHLWNVGLGLLGIVAAWKTARLLGGAAAALWTAVLLTLTPTYYGHMFNNPKDVPFAVWYMWSLYYLVRALPTFPRIPIGLAVRLGVAIGLTLAVRAGGLLLVAYLGGAIGTYLIAQTLVARRWPLRPALQLAAGLAITVSVGYGVMLLFWPFAAEHPLTALFGALGELTHFEYVDTIRFQGSVIPSTNIPWSYLPQYLLIQLPEVTLTLLAAGAAGSVVRLARGPLVAQLQASAGVLLVVFAATFPIVYIIIRQAIVYDAARHVTFVLPPIACLAGLTLAGIVRRAATLPLGGRLAVAALFILLLQAPLRAMVALHPYQYTYFNAFVGGLPGAATNYETDYWAHCYREAVLGLADRLRVEAQTGSVPEPVLVYVVEPRNSATYFFPKNFVATAERPKADFAITFRRYEGPEAFAGDRLYFTVDRLGTSLCYVFDRRVRK